MKGEDPFFSLASQVSKVLVLTFACAMGIVCMGASGIVCFENSAITKTWRAASKFPSIRCVAILNPMIPASWRVNPNSLVTFVIIIAVQLLLDPSSYFFSMHGDIFGGGDPELHYVL